MVPITFTGRPLFRSSSSTCAVARVRCLGSTISTTPIGTPRPPPAVAVPPPTRCTRDSARSRTCAICSAEVRATSTTSAAPAIRSSAGPAASTRPQSAITSASGRLSKARPSAVHRPARPADWSPVARPATTSRPPCMRCRWASSWCADRPWRAVVASDSMPMFGFSGAPLSDGVR
ncbi:hypothetical protein ACFQ9X_02840 [Catenulispora yoronensis]